VSYDIDNHFVEQFERDVHLAYQRRGSKLRNTIRVRNNVKNKTYFNKAGTGTLSTKTRHGQVPLMNVSHSRVACTTEDHYGGDYVDDLDEIRIEHSERMVLVDTAVAAAGRKTDEIIVTAMDSATNTYNSGTAVNLGAASNVGLGHNQSIREFFDDGEVPDDKRRYMSVSPTGWSQLQLLDQFTNADYVGSNGTEQIWHSGVTAKHWNTFNIFQFTGWNVDGSSDTLAKAWHYTSCGHALGREAKVTWSWENTRAAHFMQINMQQGAVIIDNIGLYEFVIDE